MWNGRPVPFQRLQLMVTSVAAQTEYGYTSGSFESNAEDNFVPSDGDWYLGLHPLTGVADQGTFYFDEFKVSEGIGASMPGSSGGKRTVIHGAGRQADRLP